MTLNFDELPGEPWQVGNSGGSAHLSAGVLTIDSPTDYYEFLLYDPDGEWNQEVSNERGWTVEARLRVDPSTEPSDWQQDRPALLLWAHDHTHLVKLGISTDSVGLSYPDRVIYSMDTTDAFHVYRLEGLRQNVKLYVDSTLVIDHDLVREGDGTRALLFGDGVVQSGSLSYWDYFWYDVSGNALTDTPLQSATPLRTATVTPPRPVLNGDANGDGRVNSIDAALILQRGAGLLDRLEGEPVADPNEDGRIDSVDAALVLQFVAGLIDSL